MSDEEMLQHYGILGMKWGVRRTPAQLTRADKTESSDEIKKMSDSELRSKINRLQCLRIERFRCYLVFAFV